MKFPIRQPNFSGGMRGPRGQFREDNQNSFVHAENFLVERDGSLRNRPPVNQTSTAGITILPTDKFLPIEANNTTYYLVYDPLLFIEWTDSGNSLPDSNIISTAPPAAQLTDQDRLQAYIDDQYTLSPNAGTSDDREDISNIRSLLGSTTDISLLANQSFVGSSRGLGLDLSSIEDYNTWRQLGHTYASIADTYNRITNYLSYLYTLHLSPKALNLAALTSSTFLSSVRSASSALLALAQYRPHITLPTISKSSLFWNRCLLYDNEGNILNHYIRRYIFTDENKDFEGTPTEFDFPTGGNILEARNTIFRDYPQWQNLEYSVAPTSGQYQVLVERTGRLPTLLIDITQDEDIESATIFDQRILYANPYNRSNVNGVRLFPSYLTSSEADNLRVGVRQGSVPNRVQEVPGQNIRNEFTQALGNTAFSVITPSDTRQNKGSATILSQPSGNALFADTTSNTLTGDIASETDPGMKLYGSPVIGAAASFIARNGGIALTPFFNGNPLISWKSINIFQNLAAAFPTGNKQRERNRGVREYPLYSNQFGAGSFSLPVGALGAEVTILGGDNLFPNLYCMTYMNPVFALQTIQIPGHDFTTQTALPLIMAPLFSSTAIGSASLATEVGTSSVFGPILNAAYGRRELGFANSDREGTYLFMVLIARKYFKNTFNPLERRITASEQNRMFSSGDFIGSGDRNVDVILSGTGSVGPEIHRVYTLPGYNSNNYFRHASHFASRYVFGGTRTQPNLIAATHSSGDSTYFDTRPKFFSFDSYSRLSESVNALALDGFRLRVTPAGGAAILRFVVLSPTPRLRIVTSQGEAEVASLTLQAVSMAQFTEQEAVSSNPIVNTYAANYQVTLDEFVVNLIQGSEELRRNRYIPVSNPFSDYITSPIVKLISIENSGRLLALVGGRLFHCITKDDGYGIWTELSFIGPIRDISVLRDIINIIIGGDIYSLDFNDRSAIEDGVSLTLSLLSPAASWLGADGLTAIEQDLNKYNYSNGMLLGQFQGPVSVGTREGDKNQSVVQDPDIIIFGQLNLENYKDSAHFDFKGRTIVIDSAFYEVGE